MKRARFFSALLVFVMALSCAVIPVPVAAEDAPIAISDVAGLKAISNNVAASYVLTADLDLAGEDWTPIATLKGKLDGQGHTISNLTVSGNDHSGLFAQLNGATVTDLNFVHAQVTTNATNSGFGGVLAGYVVGSTVSLITVDETSSVTGYNVGGIVGRTWSSLSNISYCINNATVSTDGANAGEAAGGIVGLGVYVNITYCINNGTIQHGAANGEQLTGGIAGRFGGSAATSLTYCLNTGSVSSSHTAGGIAGKNMFAGCSYENCVCTVPVTAGNKDYSGSLVGRFDSAATAADCYVVTSETYGVTGANETYAVKGTLTNVIDAKTEDERNALGTAEQAIRDAVLEAFTEPVVPTDPPIQDDPGETGEPGELTEEPTAFPAEEIATAFESGTGTWNDPYVIATAGQLAYLAQRVNNEVSYADAYFVLANDIDVGGRGWTPIGLSGEKNFFAGNFNGKGHTVRNFTVRLTDDNATVYGGLFGRVTHGTVKNLNVSGATVSIRGTSSYAGAIVGMAGDAQIIACTVADDVTVSYTGVETSANCVAGGVVGGAINASTVKYCVNRAGVLVAKPSPTVIAGGIVGLMGEATVESCINYGAISAGTATGQFNAGGIVGQMGFSGKAGIVSGCLNYGEIRSTQHGGGIVALINAPMCELRDCYTCAGVLANPDWSGLGLGRWSSYIVTINNCHYLPQEFAPEGDESVRAWLARGMGAYDAERKAGSGGLIFGDGAFTEMSEDDISDAMTAAEETIAAAILESAGQEEEEPVAPVDPVVTGEVTSDKTVTEAPTTVVTQPIDPQDEETTPEAAPEKKGCQSAIGGAAILLAIFSAAVLPIRKKKF